MDIYIVTVDINNAFGFCISISGTKYCYNTWWCMISWPDMYVYNYTMTSTGLVSTLIGPSVNMSAPSYLQTEVTTGVLNVLMTFSNLSVSFDSTTISARINNLVSQDSRGFTINAQSVTQPGSCYAATEPAFIIITQSIELTLQPHDFRFDYNADNYTGNVKFLIQCYKKVASLDFQVAINNVPGIAPFIKNNSANIIGGDIETGISSGISGAVVTAWDAFINGFLNASNWWDILLWCVIALVLLLILIGIIMCLWPCISSCLISTKGMVKNRFLNKGANNKKVDENTTLLNQQNNGYQNANWQIPDNMRRRVPYSQN
jgi:hypothetical protein